MIENNSRGRSNSFSNRIVAEVHLQIYFLGSLVDIYLIMKCDHEMAAVARRQKIGIIFRCHQRAIGNISHSWLPCCLFLASNLQQHHASANCPNHCRLNFNQNIFFLIAHFLQKIKDNRESCKRRLTWTLSNISISISAKTISSTNINTDKNHPK